MKELRIGIAGLGAASTLVLPYMRTVEGVTLTAAADVRAEAQTQFSREYGLPVFESVEALCASDAIDAVWIETPNHLHCEHVLTAAAHKKHVIVAKPMAVRLEECDRMIAACARAGVRLLQGHSKIFDSPVQAMANVIRSGRLGRVIAIDSWWHNDWLRRPHLLSELDETKGAGFIHRQMPHLVDVTTYIANAPAIAVRALIGRWDTNLPTDGNVAALIQFEGGAYANVSLNGYGYFGTSELVWDIGLFGKQQALGKPVPRLAGMNETEKYATASLRERKPGAFMPFVGVTVVSCERGVMRQSPHGLYLYTDEGREEVPVPPYLGRASELLELRDALRDDRDVFPDGAWGKANLEICLAILASARQGQDVPLHHQTGSPAKRQ